MLDVYKRQRYTIIDSIPYDRENTSMVDFPMCDFCESQYTELEDRRYHAQTISCHECGPMLLWKGAHGGDLETYGTSGVFLADSANGADACDTDNDILDHAAEILKNGGVIAFKSVGGYNLVACLLYTSVKGQRLAYPGRFCACRLRRKLYCGAGNIEFHDAVFNA